MVFLVYSIALPTIAASFWAAGQGKGDMALKLQIIGGAECFVVSAFLWYLFVGAMLESVKFPVSLPTGDLSRFWGSSEAVDEEKAKSR